MIVLYHKRAESAMYGRHIGAKSFFVRKIHQYYDHTSKNGEGYVNKQQKRRNTSTC